MSTGEQGGSQLSSGFLGVLTSVSCLQQSCLTIQFCGKPRALAIACVVLGSLEAPRIAAHGILGFDLITCDDWEQGLYLHTTSLSKLLK